MYPRFLLSTSECCSKWLVFPKKVFVRDCAHPIIYAGRIVRYIHVEIILEAEKDACIQKICEQMGRTPCGLPILYCRVTGMNMTITE